MRTKKGQNIDQVKQIMANPPIVGHFGPMRKGTCGTGPVGLMLGAEQPKLFDHPVLEHLDSVRGGIPDVQLVGGFQLNPMGQ